MEDVNSLSEFLKKFACDRRLSLREFAKILGISHSYLNKLMIGFNPNNDKPISPTIYTLFKIADALEIPHLEFLQICGYIERK